MESPFQAPAGPQWKLLMRKMPVQGQRKPRCIQQGSDSNPPEGSAFPNPPLCHEYKPCLEAVHLGMLRARLKNMPHSPCQKQSVLSPESKAATRKVVLSQSPTAYSKRTGSGYLQARLETLNYTNEKSTCCGGPVWGTQYNLQPPSDHSCLSRLSSPANCYAIQVRAADVLLPCSAMPPSTAWSQAHSHGDKLPHSSRWQLGRMRRGLVSHTNPWLTSSGGRGNGQKWKSGKGGSWTPLLKPGRAY